MSFHVICSTADGNQTKKFSDWESAHQYANEWMDGFTHWNHRHFNSVESTEYVNLWKTRNGETVKIQEIKSNDDCPNCADQASIAAPGQTTLCKTHQDDGEIDELIDEIPTDIHYEPNKPNLSENNEAEDLTSIEFFVANVKSYHASVFGVYCSNCFESGSTIAVTTNNYTMFEFCKPCYDKLKRAMIARDAKS